MKVPSVLLAGALLFVTVGTPAGAHDSRPDSAAAFLVEKVVEKTVERLPSGPLYWRLENFPTLGEAQFAAGSMSLAAEVSGRAWLFTLGPSGSVTPGGRVVAEIGPIPVIDASSYVIRVNRATAPPGATSSVHTHPGSEAFHVLTGQLTQRTPRGVTRLDAGQSMNGHDPGIVMQLESTGSTALEQLVLFVVDATKPFSSPAAFD